MSVEGAGVEGAGVDGEGDGAAMARSRTEPRAFAEIFDRHFPTVHRHLARRLGTQAADDLAGEVFRLAFQRRDHFDPRWDSARPWLLGFANNLVHGRRRSELRHLRALERLAGREDRAPASDFVAVDDRLETSADASRAVEALATLAGGDRDALVLFAVDGLSYAEVAQALGIPVGTVRSRIHRARTRLRQHLAETESAIAHEEQR